MARTQNLTINIPKAMSLNAFQLLLEASLPCTEAGSSFRKSLGRVSSPMMASMKADFMHKKKGGVWLA
jgi:hypothetical protein